MVVEKDYHLIGSGIGICDEKSDKMNHVDTNNLGSRRAPSWTKKNDSIIPSADRTWRDIDGFTIAVFLKLLIPIVFIVAHQAALRRIGWQPHPRLLQLPLEALLALSLLGK